MGRPWGSPKGAVDRDMDRGTLIGVLGLSELELKPIPNTGPYYTDASAAGGSGRTCVAQSDERRGRGSGLWVRSVVYVPGLQNRKAITKRNKPPFGAESTPLPSKPWSRRR